MSWLLCVIGFAVNFMDSTAIAILCTFIPILNTILTIYLWYKYLKNTGFSIKSSISDFISDLRNL